MPLSTEEMPLRPHLIKCSSRCNPAGTGTIVFYHIPIRAQEDTRRTTGDLQGICLKCIKHNVVQYVVLDITIMRGISSISSRIRIYAAKKVSIRIIYFYNFFRDFNLVAWNIEHN